MVKHRKFMHFKIYINMKCFKSRDIEFEQSVYIIHVNNRCMHDQYYSSKKCTFKVHVLVVNHVKILYRCHKLFFFFLIIIIHIIYISKASRIEKVKLNNC